MPRHKTKSTSIPARKRNYFRHPRKHQVNSDSYTAIKSLSILDTETESLSIPHNDIKLISMPWHKNRVIFGPHTKTNWISTTHTRTKSFDFHTKYKLLSSRTQKLS